MGVNLKYVYDTERTGEWYAQNQPSNALEIPKTLHSPLTRDELVFLPVVYTWERSSRVWARIFQSMSTDLS